MWVAGNQLLRVIFPNTMEVNYDSSEYSTEETRKGLKPYDRE